MDLPGLKQSPPRQLCLPAGLMTQVGHYDFGTNPFLLWSMNLICVGQAAQRGQAAAILTQAEEGDPLGEHYGDPPLIQSQSRSDKVWTEISDIIPALEGQKVGYFPEVPLIMGSEGSSC